MAIERVYGFIAQNQDLIFYNGKAIIDLSIENVFDDEDETAFTFIGYSSSYMYIYDSEERNYLVKSFTTQITRNSNYQVINASESDMTFPDGPGKFYYELGYVTSGGYEIALRYGNLFIK